MDGFDESDVLGWTFGPFRLSPREKYLTDEGVPVRLGSRAFAVLVALVERAGEVLSVDELMTRAWPNTFVEEATVRVHIHALKKVLGDGRGSVRYIVNESGRGYCFVAPVSLASRPADPRNNARSARLPGRVSRMVGRSATVDNLCALIPERRLLTLVGTGGVGKTTVAIAVAERLRSQYADDVYFIDLTTLNDPNFLISTVARPFGFSPPKAGALTAFVTFLADRRMLLVIDNCEHLVGAAAEFVEAIHRGAPKVLLLCTSREPLRADGEWIFRLNGLSLPPHDAVSSSEALAFEAVELFVERTLASQQNFSLSQDNVAAVCRICRHLDGLPLALELAAASLDGFSLTELLARLDDRFALLTKGRRTAAPRQQTMRATLDWSHALLSPEERILFRRLAIFRSAFDLESAVACCTCETLSAATVVEGIGDLTAKSLLNADVSGETTLFRLLESTRVYAYEQLSSAEERHGVSRTHAQLVHDKLTRAAEEWPTLDRPLWLGRYGRLIDDVRSAIDWSLGPGEDHALGIAITILAGQLAFELSLLGEFLARYERAFTLMPTIAHHPGTEARLAIGLARFLFHAGGPHDRAIELTNRAVAVAEESGSDIHMIEAMTGVWVMGISVADYAAMNRASTVVRRLSERSGDRVTELFAMRMGAVAHAFTGDIDGANWLSKAVFDDPTPRVVLNYHAQLALELPIFPSIARARALFLQGDLAGGIALARASMEQTCRIEHQQHFMIVMGLLACPIALWSGDWPLAEELLGHFNRHIDRYSAAYYRNQWARGFKEALRLCEGSISGTSPATDYHTLLQDHLCTIHEDFVTPTALARADAGHAGWCASETFRAEGNRLRRRGSERAGEALLRKAIELARRQGARFWELRAATDLAALLQHANRQTEAIAVLDAVYPAFVDGPQIRDVQRAGSLWSDLINQG